MWYTFQDESPSNFFVLFWYIALIIIQDTELVHLNSLVCLILSLFFYVFYYDFWIWLVLVNANVIYVSENVSSNINLSKPLGSAMAKWENQ